MKLMLRRRYLGIPSRRLVVAHLPTPNSSKPNQAALQSDPHRLCAALDAKLLEQCVYMQFHRTLRDVKLGANLLVSFSLSNELKHLQLACGQLQAGDAAGEFRGDCWRESSFTGMHIPDALKQISWFNILQQISLRSRPDGPPARVNDFETLLLII